MKIITSSIIVFVLLFVTIAMTKPQFLFNHDGSPRQFGIGYSKKTILPIWIVSLLLGILCYFAVLCASVYHRMDFT